MANRKQQLLKRHRRNKRVTLIVLLLSIFLISACFSWWLLAIGLVFLWLSHEAWFADHQFYSSCSDYQYRFPDDGKRYALALEQDRLQLPVGAQLNADATLVAKVVLKSTLLGRLFDPSVYLADDYQTFERGVNGVRFLNLTGLAAELQKPGIAVAGRFCRLAYDVQLFVFEQQSPANDATMILAPHADDAEIAAFALYKKTRGVSIVTLTQGEIEAGNYQHLGIDINAATRLKGRLRSWDSMAIPLWGGVPQSRCVQLGYFCMRLPEMAREPSQPFGSRVTGDKDTRVARQHNTLQLPADKDGAPSWNNLVADLLACLEHFRPQTVVLPHPTLDPHPDHIATHRAFYEALAVSEWQPARLLLYANHLHDNDRWPMGAVYSGVALPPALEVVDVEAVWSHLLTPAEQRDKAMALRMQHDLQTKLPAKKRIRRIIQQRLTGRHWPQLDGSDYFRKAVRRHELFFVKYLR